MRNATVFGMPLSFTWNVDPDGHRWMQSASGLTLVANGDLDSTMRGIFYRPMRSYQPFEQKTGLFREFASLEATEKHVLEFADRFGLLGDSETVVVKTESGSQQVTGESGRGFDQVRRCHRPLGDLLFHWRNQRQKAPEIGAIKRRSDLSVGAVSDFPRRRLLIGNCRVNPTDDGPLANVGRHRTHLFIGRKNDGGV